LPVDSINLYTQLVQFERHMFRPVFIAFVGLSCALGCARNQDARRVLALPSGKWQTTHFAGSVLSGPQMAVPPAVVPADALEVKVSLLLLQNAVSTGASLGVRAELVLAQRQAQPVLPSTHLTVGGRVLTGRSELAAMLALPPSQAIVAGSARTALQVGSTFDASFTPAVSFPQLQLFISRPADQPQLVVLAIAVTDEVSIATENESVDPEAAATQPAGPSLRQVQRELALVKFRAEDTPVALIVPAQFRDSPAKFAAMIVEVSPGSDDPNHAAALAEAREQMLASAKAAAAETAISPSRNVSQAIGAALAQAQTSQRRRSSLVYLATANNAPIASDVALLAEDALLERFTAMLDQQYAAGQSMSPAQWSLALDLVALKSLSELQAAAKLPPELQSVLLQHTGEIGRHSGTIEEVIAGVGSRDELNAKIVAENLIYLADHSPAARVRAFDWLAARSAAPQNFDPLADARARRAALERAATRPATP
jgi:hypothetical protein